ncbi:MAG: outer membrane lipoprotein-sorting protein [Elusimicrobia bacterium]|nr:outer membrane lipoprotein-sorting protein [Elusimicrobiota bacterium]
MSTKRALIALLALSAAAWRAGAAVEELPDAAEVLRAGASHPAAPYTGEVSVVTWYGKRTRAKELLVHFSPPNRFRREIVDHSGYTAQIVVSDGKQEWVYDRAHGRVWKTTPEDADYKLLGPEEEFDLLAQNYDSRVTGQETVAGRPCWVVEIRGQKDSRSVRTLWIDQKTGVMLQTKSFLADGTVASTMRFVKIEFPGELDEELFRFTPPVGAVVVKSKLKPGYLELEDARIAGGVPPVPPKWLPNGYVFESVNVLPYNGSTFLHFKYSDGIDAMSLFQCPKSVRLDFGDLAEEPVRMAGGSARLSFGPDGKILEWPRQGQRFVLVGNLPLETLRRVAESVQ